jgi:hypothetical protein
MVEITGPRFVVITVTATHITRSSLDRATGHFPGGLRTRPVALGDGRNGANGIQRNGTGYFDGDT